MIDLADEAADLALRTGPIDGIPGHLQQVLFRFPWVTCASPHYLAQRGTPLRPADLIGHDLIALRNQRTGLVDPWRYRHVAGAQGDAVRWVPSPRVIVDDANAVHAAAIAGAGVLWAPRWLVCDSLRTERLMPILSDWSADEMNMSIIRRD